MTGVARKWNYETHEYELFVIPDEWHCTLYSNNMNSKINCPHCGKELTYGESYTSLEIHNPIGLGYAICENCHKQELLRRVAKVE